MGAQVWTCHEAADTGYSGRFAAERKMATWCGSVIGAMTSAAKNCANF